jgi:hypothetical protein
MSPIANFFDPLRRAAAAFFKHDLALKRERDGLHIVLEAKTVSDGSSDKAVANKKSKPGKGEREMVAERKVAEELALMRTQLAELLDEVPETRLTMRHLVMVEQALGKKGLRVLHKMPLDVLQRAHEQLEGLVTNWSPVGLASLRSKMAVAILDREHMDPAATEADSYRTAAVMDQAEALSDPRSEQPEVKEVSDDDALAAAYAALGHFAPSGEIEFQGELGSRSAKAVAPPTPRAGDHAREIKLREVQT